MWIPVSKITVNEQRLNEEKLDDFVEDIGRGRKMKPITVRHAPTEDECPLGYCGIHSNAIGDGKCIHCDDWITFAIVDGHHRLEAYKILGKEMIEVVVTL